MRIGELARRSELSASRIRFYETHGLLPKAERRGNGYRDYGDGAVEILHFINVAQSLGFSLGEIKTGLAKAGPNSLSKQDMLEALQQKLISLEQHIEEVTHRRQRIVELIEHFESEYARANWPR